MRYKNGVITTRVTYKEINMLKELADKLGISVSQIVRACIAPFLENEFREDLKKNLNKGQEFNVAVREARLNSAR